MRKSPLSKTQIFPGTASAIQRWMNSSFGGKREIVVFISCLLFTFAVSTAVFADEAAVLSESETKTVDIVPATESSETSGGLETADELDRALNSLFGNYFDTLALDSAFQTYFVKGDRGRFRQDSFMDDRSTGGFKKIAFSGKQKDISYEFEGRALVDYDYLAKVKLRRDDGYYLNSEWKHFRKFWDGSQDLPWDPTTSNLLPSLFGDWPDAGLHTDRDTITTEFGKPLTEDAKLIIKHELWKKKGRDTLLRGEQAVRTGLNTLRTLEMRRRVDGVSNKVTVSAPFQTDQKHNWEPSISLEAYRDSQFTDSARYLASGALNQKRDYIDRYQWYDVRAKIKYDSFITDDVYIHGGYFANYLRNDSVRSETRPNSATAPSLYVDPEVDNWRVSNVVNFGAALLNFMQKKGLDVRIGTRAEHAFTDAHGTIEVNRVDIVGSRSQLNEGWLGEALSLTYKGIKNTTFFLGLDMEQKRLHWKEKYDARYMEATTVFGSSVTFPRYKTDITYIDFLPKAKITHKFNHRVKANLVYKLQEKERHYNYLSDNVSTYYPGYLGDQQRWVQNTISSLDVRLGRAWSSSLKHEFIMDNIEFEVGDQQQNLDRQRISTAISGPLCKKLFGYFTGMYDFYRVDTPTEGPGTNRWSRGKEDYDFNGDVVILATNLNYNVSEPVNLYLNYQITDSIGGDNNNTLNEAAVGVRYNLNKTTSLEARYLVFNFQDKRGIDGGYDDDYYGQGMSFGLKKALG